MYGIVLPTLFLICSGIVNSKPTISVSEGDTETSPAIVITDSLTPTTDRPLIGRKNCSYQYIGSVKRDYLQCIHSLEHREKNQTSNASLIYNAFCKTIPFEECLHNASSNLSECIEDQNNEASRLATFYAAEGPTCFEEKGEAIDLCNEFPRHNANVNRKHMRVINYTPAMSNDWVKTMSHISNYHRFV